MVGRILTQLKRQGQLIEPPRSGVTGSRRALRPRTPLPIPQTQTGSGQQSSVATRLAANENTGFFLGMVKPQPGDISIVENAGTFLMWYDTP